MNPKQQAFACEMLRHGNRAEAYRNAYQPKSNNPKSLQSAADRLMKNTEIADAIWSAQERMYAEVYEEVKARVLHEVLTVQRKREILAQIAEGQWMKQPPPEEMHDQPTAVLIPTLKDRLKAIDMDNKMAGAYETEIAPGDNKQQQDPPAEQSGDDPVIYTPDPAVFIPSQGSKEKASFILPAIDRNPQLNKKKAAQSMTGNMTTQPPAWLRSTRV